MNTISRFGSPKNLTVDYTLREDYINSLVNDLTSQNVGDSLNPYNFREWHKRNIYLTPATEAEQYTRYLCDWYANRFKPQLLTNRIKEDYLNFIKELDIRFDISSDLSKGWTEDIDFSNEEDIDEAISIFAKKLKEIAIYFINKRESLKRAKLKYNLVGTKNAIERVFYEYLLKAFTKRQYILNVPEQSAWNKFPDLSAVNTGFQILIEELYDDENYLDRSPYVPLSTYFNYNSEKNIDYYCNTLNFPFSAMDWLFNTGTMYLCSDDILLWNVNDVLAAYNVTSIEDVPLSAFSYPDKLNLIDYIKINLARKYIGTNQYILSGGYYKLWTKDFEYEIIEGNNWIYWPYGEYYLEQKLDKNYSTIDPIELTATNLINNGATPNYFYQNADKIFVITDNGVSGAWLKLTTTKLATQEMSCLLLPNDTTYFKYPYPGYGLSGEGLKWTGPQLSNLTENNILINSDIRKNIEYEYWNNTSYMSAVEPIFIQNTNLIDCGAHPASSFDIADRLTIRVTNNSDNTHDSNINGVYNADMINLWLFEFKTTDIPIKSGKNYIYWPLNRYDEEDTIPFIVTQDFCTPTPLSTIFLSSARAGHGLFDSDIIYKLDSKNGYAIECAFLCGNQINGYNNTTYTANTTGVIQPSLSIVAIPGEASTFIWTDTDKDINDTLIKHVPHQIDCPYLKLKDEKKLISLYNYRPAQEVEGYDYSQWQKCDCGAIMYSPLGHPGSNFDQYDQFADYIILDTSVQWGSGQYTFDLATWKDENGNDYKNSSDFAWFKLNSNTLIEPDVGWSNGSWVNYNGSGTFTLKKGKLYKYVRCKLRRTDIDFNKWPVAGIVIKQPYTFTNKCQWKKALLKADGTWKETDTPTDMVLYPGDYILYDRMDTLWYCITTSSTKGITYPYISPYNNNPFSYWSTYTHAPTSTTLQIYWPVQYYFNGPSKKRSEISTVDWYVKKPGETSYSLLGNHATVINYTLANNLIGNYYISAVGSDGSTQYDFGNIPPIEAFAQPTPYLSGDITQETIYTPVANFMINQQLSGWDYTHKKPQKTAIGARPYWAYGSNKSDSITKYKGIDKWGNSIKIIDGYSLVTNPYPANEYIKTGNYIEYYNSGNDSLIWKENLDFGLSSNEINWCKLDINLHVNTPLSSFINTNIKDELVISATDIISNLLLIPKIDDKFVYINYYAINPFTWHETLSNTSLGCPPTGGIWVDYLTGSIINPDMPYSNLLNRHYPTIATIPSLDNIYSEDEVGGYFIPRLMGISTFLSKNPQITIDPLRDVPTNLETDTRARGITAVFQNPSVFNSTVGLTKKEQKTLTKLEKTDPSWMKADVTEYFKAGNIINSINYQNFIPYKTVYEVRKDNNIGIRRQSDLFDPWTGPVDNTWDDLTNYSLDFRTLQPIEKWYHEHLLLPTDKIMYQWKSDIYNNEYGLYKYPLSSCALNADSYGELWVRKQNGMIVRAYNKDYDYTYGALNKVFDNFNLFTGNNTAYPYLFDQLTGNQIIDIDVWYDTLMIRTSDYLIFNKIKLSSDGEIFALSDDINIISISANYGYQFAGTWFNESENFVDICLLGVAPIYSVVGSGIEYSGGVQSNFMDISGGSYENNEQYPYSMFIEFSANNMDLPTSAWSWDFGDGTILYPPDSSYEYYTHLYKGYTETNTNIIVGLTGYLEGDSTSYLISSFNITIYPMLSALNHHIYIPKIYKINIENNILSDVLNINSSNNNNKIYGETSILYMSSIRDSLFTFNKLTNLYNIVFIGNCYLPYNGVGIGSIYITNNYEIDSISIVRPKPII